MPEYKWRAITVAGREIAKKPDRSGVEVQFRDQNAAFDFGIQVT